MFERKKIPFFLIPLCVLLAVLALRFFFNDKFEEFSLRIFDRFQQARPRIYEPMPVRFLDLDDESLARHGQWPWPRTRLAELLEKLAKQKAAVVVMDILFAEPDRTSPANILPLWESSLPENLALLKDDLKKLPDHDKVLGEAMKKLPVITGFSLTDEPTPDVPMIKAGFAHSGDDPVLFLPFFKGAIPSIPILEKSAAGNGSVNFLSETDGVLRRVPLLFHYQGKLVPSLAAEALRVAEGASSYVVKSSGGSGETSFGEKTGIISVKIGSHVIPTDSMGRIWLSDTGNVKDRYLPVWKVMEGKADPALIENSILFIGSSAAGLKDLRTTPLNPVAAGTEVHVQLIEQMVLGKFLVRPDWAPGAEILFIFFLGLLLIFLLPHLGAAASAIFGFSIIAAAAGFSWYAYLYKHWLIDPITPLLACFLIYLTVTLMNYLQVETEKRQVRSAFGMYVSSALLEKISKNPESLKLGGEMRPMSLLFADIRNFTSISEQLSAEELTHFMNRYLTPMSDIILKTSGTIDKYIGDCIMAFWNAPLSDPQHEKHACDAALNMLSYLKDWNRSIQEEFEKLGKKFHPISIGIGINSGECCVGNMGSDQRFDYSVLGDEVNLASRLESQSKIYGIDVVLGQNTYDKLQDFLCLELDILKVKGKTKPIRIYGLLGRKDSQSNSIYTKLTQQHQKMLEAYRGQRWQEAEEILNLLLKIQDGFQLEKLYQLYHQRIQEYKMNPPEASWDGVATALTK